MSKKNLQPQIAQMNADKKLKKHLRQSAPSVDKKTATDNSLFDRVATILEQARGNVVRAVNTNMVLAYWLIGREIVMELQGGKGRAEYGKQVVEDLSGRLTERYGKGFSITNLWDFRLFYMVFSDRRPILRPMGGESAGDAIQYPVGTKLLDKAILRPLGGELPQGFSPQLTWSHYRALMRVENREARDFYEREAVAGGWDKRVLERQIHSYYFERIQKSRKPDKMLAEGRALPVLAIPAVGELTHSDVGQMDGYVRMFDDLTAAQDDNPTIGLILCTEKNETVARYSVLKDRKQIFASKYMLCLPTEEQLRLEIEKERKLIEASVADKKGTT